MSHTVNATGMHLRNLLEDEDFHARREPSSLDPWREAQALRRLTRVLAGSPIQDVLQEVVDLAVELCGADSSGISLEEHGSDVDRRFRWIVVAGSFSRYVNGTTPRFFSPCGTCLDRNQPQIYSVSQPYYDFLGVEAEDISEGLLIPWIAGEQRGTLWAVNHDSHRIFSPRDYELLKTLADFASIAIGYRQQQQRAQLAEQRAALNARAHQLAHEINNPLQSITNSLYIAQNDGPDSKQHLEQAAADLAQLSKLGDTLLRSDTEPAL